MAHSLSDECTPLKREYDSCFNAWFEGYLEPAVAASPEQRTRYSQEKAAEYERNCGKIWSQYRECVQVTVIYVFHHCVSRTEVLHLSSLFLGGNHLHRKQSRRRVLMFS